MGAGEGGATLVGALGMDMGVASPPAGGVGGGGATRRRGAALGPAVLPDTAELISVDILPSSSSYDINAAV